MTTKRMLLGLAGLAALQAAAATPQRATGPQPISYPNPLLKTHEGKAVRFFDDLLKGRKVAINMMYTTCTGICPGNTANLRLVHEQLGERIGRDFHMISISLRPEFDDPAALAAYVKQYGIGRGWTYVTGRPADVETIRRKLGFFDADPAMDADIGNHTGMLRVGNIPSNRWCMVPAMATPNSIVKAIVNI